MEYNSWKIVKVNYYIGPYYIINKDEHNTAIKFKILKPTDLFLSVI